MIPNITIWNILVYTSVKLCKKAFGLSTYRGIKVCKSSGASERVWKQELGLLQDPDSLNLTDSHEHMDERPEKVCVFYFSTLEVVNSFLLTEALLVLCENKSDKRIRGEHFSENALVRSDRSVHTLASLRSYLIFHSSSFIILFLLFPFPSRVSRKKEGKESRMKRILPLV